MSGLVQRYNGSNISYTDSRFTGWNGGTKKLCVRTKAGSAASDVISYPLTTNTTASQYCHFVVRVNGSNCRLATRSTWNYTDTKSANGSISSKSASTQFNNTSAVGYTYTSNQAVGASYTLQNTLVTTTRSQLIQNTYQSFYGGATESFLIGRNENGLHKTTPESEYRRTFQSTSFVLTATSQRKTIYSTIKIRVIPYASGSMFTGPANTASPKVLDVIPLGTHLQNKMGTANIQSSNKSYFSTYTQIGPPAEFNGNTMTINFSISTSGYVFGQTFHGTRADGFDVGYSPTTYSSLMNGNNVAYLTYFPRTQYWSWTYTGHMQRSVSGTRTSETVKDIEAFRYYSYTLRTASAKRSTRTSRQGVSNSIDYSYGTVSIWKISSTRQEGSTYGSTQTTWTMTASSHNANI